MYEWITNHLFNSFWFLVFCISLPFAIGIYLFYKLFMVIRNQDNQGNETNQ